MWLLVVVVAQVALCEDSTLYSPSRPPSAASHARAGAPRATKLGDLCGLPVDIGSCSRELIRYYYDAAEDDCKRFTYSGCGGNANRFMRRTNCRNRCVKNTEKKPEKVTQALTKKPGMIDRISSETKQRHTVTTTPRTSTTVKKFKMPKTASVRRVAVTKASPNIRDCPHCDPLFGVCEENGECGCIAGFRKFGKICIDVNECDQPNACPPNSRCVNTMGSFRCDCDAGFSADGQCIVRKEACDDVFDVRYTEEDCNHGEQQLRYYYEHETRVCREFFYGGCIGESKNIFADAQACESLCANGRKSIRLEHASRTGNETSVLVSISDSVALDSVRLHTTDATVTVLTTGSDVRSSAQQGECNKPFEEVLRLECMEAKWVERFFWNVEKTECEPFWYDSTCDPKDVVGKNFFETLESCENACPEGGPSVTPSAASVDRKSDEMVVPTSPKTLAEKPDEVTGRISSPRRIFSAEDPFGLLERQQTADKLLQTTHKAAPSHRQEISNFVAKTSLEPFDRKKYMEEFKKKLTALPEGYKQTSLPPEGTQALETVKSIGERKQATPRQEAHPEVHRLDTSKRLQEKFDRKKFIEEFKKKLNALPDDYVKKSKMSVSPTNSSGIEESATTNDSLDVFSSKEQVFTVEATSDIPQGPPSSKSLPLLHTSRELGIEKFDREKFIEEFKKKLTALPDGSNRKSPIDFSRSFKWKHEPFTLPPSLFLRQTTPPSTIKMRKFPKSKASSRASEIAEFHVVSAGDAEKRTEEFEPQEKDAYTVIPEPMPTSDFVAETKKVVEKTLEELSRPKDLCDEPLHPKLEEDCNHENWELRWFFNKERGACKSFWYGGCEADARNFFGDIKSCKKTCGHKYPVTAEALKPQYYVSPTRLITTDPIVSQPPLTSTYAPDVDIFKGYSEDTSKTTRSTRTTTKLPPTTTALREETISFVRTVGSTPKTKLDVSTDIDKKSKEAIIGEATTSVPVISESATMDVCDQGYDPKWDEDCAGDNWIVRAYFEPAKNGCKRIWWGGCITNNKNLWMNLVECQNACAHKMETSSTPFPPFTLPPIVASSTESPQFFNASMSHIAADDPLAHTRPSNPFTLVHPRNVPFIFPLKSSPKPKFQLRVKATLVTRYTTLANIQNATSSHITTEVVTINTSTQQPLSTLKDGPFFASHEHRSTFSQHQRRATTGDTDRTTTGVANLRFRSDLDRQLAKVKRRKENREDLVYSSLVNHPVTVASECLEPFDLGLAKSCNNGTEWKNRFHYDRDLRVCRMYWHGGCFSSSRNDFEDHETCQWKCMGTHPKPAARACLDSFDKNYSEDCRHGEFSDRYFFNHNRKKCEHFHWGGCRSSSENIFVDIRQCQELCESPARELSQSCLEPFDDAYRESCSHDGRFKQYFYFDQAASACRMFWFGNCRGTSQNIYPSLDLCQWTCERRRDERIPAYCMETFDTKYKDFCDGGQWRERAYFDQESGACTSFWWDGCTSTSQNFFSDLNACQSICEHPGYEPYERMPISDTRYRCLLPKKIGTCKETYPFYHFDRITKSCSPFSYSGCGGNENRFMTLSQCHGLCEPFMHMTETEMDCYFPLDQGFGRNNKTCVESAGYRFHFNSELGKCLQFWYFGCGGNVNTFYSYELCQRSCASQMPRVSRKPRASSNVCFRPPGDKGNCPGNANHTVQRWTYTAQLRCAQFTYSGCGGSDNRFATQMECELTCKGKKPSNNAGLCSYDPDSGSCNQLRYLWFYNQTRGTCDQFLYGGCGGNPNRFETFEVCQKTCEVSGLVDVEEPYINCDTENSSVPRLTTMWRCGRRSGRKLFISKFLVPL